MEFKFDRFGPIAVTLVSYSEFHEQVVEPLGHLERLGPAKTFKSWKE
jgi:hypothetical protein